MIVKGANPAAMTWALIMSVSEGFLAKVLINAVIGKVGPGTDRLQSRDQTYQNKSFDAPQEVIKTALLFKRISGYVEPFRCSRMQRWTLPMEEQNLTASWRGLDHPLHTHHRRTAGVELDVHVEAFC